MILLLGRAPVFFPTRQSPLVEVFQNEEEVLENNNLACPSPPRRISGQYCAGPVSNAKRSEGLRGGDPYDLSRSSVDMISGTQPCGINRKPPKEFILNYSTRNH